MYPVFALYHYYPEQFWVRYPLTIALLAAGIALAILLYKKGKISSHSMGWGIALWTYTLFILYMTVIGRYSFDDYRYRLELFASYREYLATGNETDLFGIVGNTTLFIPFAFIAAELSRGSKPVITALAGSLALTVLIESAQFITRTGTFELDDLFHNFAGGAAGILIWLLLSYMHYRTVKINNLQ